MLFALSLKELKELAEGGSSGVEETKKAVMVMKRNNSSGASAVTTVILAAKVIFQHQMRMMSRLIFNAHLGKAINWGITSDNEQTGSKFARAQVQDRKCCQILAGNVDLLCGLVGSVSHDCDHPLKCRPQMIAQKEELVWLGGWDW